MFGKHHGFSAAYTRKDVDEVLNRLEETAKEIVDYYIRLCHISNYCPRGK